jgi:Leucine-rich repeat (LRR) protein
VRRSRTALASLGLMAMLSVTITSCSESPTDANGVTEDGIAPAQVENLAVASFTDSCITLAWTAPGDDSTSGTASFYDIRYSTIDNLWSDWDSTELVPGEPTPKAAGSPETLAVNGLMTDSTYYFAMRTGDEAGNWSFISNVAHATCFNDFVVGFFDPNLEDAVREVLTIPTGDIYRSDLFGIEELQASNRGIINLAGLEYCVNLEILDLEDNLVSDIGRLAGLGLLRELRLDHNMLSDVSPLSGLSHLENLYLRDNQIGDISPVSGLTNLQLLFFTSNSVADISSLSGLASLTYLDAMDNEISDISALSALTRLTTLLLDYNSITDITALTGLIDIQNLSLRYNQITDISPLVVNSGLGSGDELWLDGNPLSAQSVDIPTLEARSVTVHY